MTRKRGTLASVFSRKLAHGNSKIEIRQKETGENKRGMKVERSTMSTKEVLSASAKCPKLFYSSSHVRHSRQSVKKFPRK